MGKARMRKETTQFKEIGIPNNTSRRNILICINSKNTTHGYAIIV